jgi:hypothetical protein
MSQSMFAFLLRVYGPHFLVTPVLLLGWLVDYLDPPVALVWVRWLLFLSLLGCLGAAWSASSMAVGRTLVGFAWLVTALRLLHRGTAGLLSLLRKGGACLWRKSVAWDPEVGNEGCLPMIALAVMGIVLFTVLSILSRALGEIGLSITRVSELPPLAGIIWFQGTDLVLLTASLLYNGGFGFSVTEGGADSVEGQLRRAAREHEAAVRQVDAIAGLSETDRETMKIKLEEQLEKKIKRITEGSDGNPLGN